MAKFDKVLSYKIKVSSTMPLHVGCNDDGFILTDGREPYIQANSLSGAFGSYAEEKWGKIKKENLFGSKDRGKSKIVFSDGRFSGKWRVELRPHVKIDSKTETAFENGKFDIQLLGTGVSLEFKIDVFQKKNEDFSENVEELLSAFGSGNIILGGQKTNGCGCFEITEIMRSVCDMYNEEQRNSYLNENMKYEVINCNLGESDFYSIELKGEIKNSLIVKSGGTVTTDDDGNAVDCETIKNSDGKYIVPASSVKGVIKSQMKKITDYFGIDFEIDNTDRSPFDYIYFEDAIIEDAETMIMHRVKIDKFTGGAFDKGKFSEMPVKGKLTIKVRINKNAKFCKPLTALVLYSLRDLACGAISLGGLTCVGRGFITGEAVEIDGKNDPEFINDCMSELSRLKKEVG